MWALPTAQLILEQFLAEMNCAMPAKDISHMFESKRSHYHLCILGLYYRIIVIYLWLIDGISLASEKPAINRLGVSNSNVGNDRIPLEVHQEFFCGAIRIALD